MVGCMPGRAKIANYWLGYYDTTRMELKELS